MESPYTITIASHINPSIERGGKKAEDENLRKIMIEEIEQSAKEAKRFKTSYFTLKLNEHQRIIYFLTLPLDNGKLATILSAPDVQGEELERILERIGFTATMITSKSGLIYAVSHKS